MVSPARTRDAVRYLTGRDKVSERRTCRVVGQHRSTQRYRGISPDFEQRLVKRMIELTEKYPRYGYRRIWTLLRSEGFEVNKKRIERLWRLEGNRVPPPRKSRQKVAKGSAGNSARQLWAAGPGDIWSIDFVHARTATGSPIRIFNVVDEFTRLALGSRVAGSIGTRDLIEHLDSLLKVHRAPRIIRSDNGRELTSSLLTDWSARRGIKQAFIAPGSPLRNAFLERFNGTMRDEVLNGESFDTVLEARVIIEAWIIDYNEHHPHRGLGMKTPIGFRQLAGYESDCPRWAWTRRKGVFP